MDDGQLLETTGNYTRDVWKDVCLRMSQDDSLILYERAIYAALRLAAKKLRMEEKREHMTTQTFLRVLFVHSTVFSLFCFFFFDVRSGNLRVLLSVCSTWEDALWAHFLTMVDMRVERVCCAGRVFFPFLSFSFHFLFSIFYSLSGLPFDIDHSSAVSCLGVASSPQHSSRRTSGPAAAIRPGGHDAVSRGWSAIRFMFLAQYLLFCLPWAKVVIAELRSSKSEDISDGAREVHHMVQRYAERAGGFVCIF